MAGIRFRSKTQELGSLKRSSFFFSRSLRLKWAPAAVRRNWAGLAISRQLVELMGGSIGVDSEPGRGAPSFSMCHFLDHEGESASSRVDRVSALAGARVLVVDDNESALEI